MPDPDRRLPSRLAPLVLAASLSLAACSGEAEKAAAPFPAAAASLGVDGLTFGKSTIESGAVVLEGMDWSKGAAGTAHADAVTVDGFRGDAANWTAKGIKVERLAGRIKAERAYVDSPSSVAKGTARAEATYLEGAEATLLGVPFRAARASYAPAPNGGTRYAATGLRLTDPSTLPPSLAGLADAAWDVEAVLRDDLSGRVALDLRWARSELGNVSASVSVLLPSGSGAAILSGMSARDLLDPSRWPEGTALRAVEMTLTLQAPPKGTPSMDGVPDPRMRDVLAATRAAKGPVAWTIQATPPTPIPMRELPGILARPDSYQALGLRFVGDSIGFGPR